MRMRAPSPPRVQEAFHSNPFPDVTVTPSPGGSVPIPYPNVDAHVDAPHVGLPSAPGHAHTGAFGHYAEESNVRLQSTLTRRQQMFEAGVNISKRTHDTSERVIDNLSGAHDSDFSLGGLVGGAWGVAKDGVGRGRDKMHRLTGNVVDEVADRGRDGIGTVAGGVEDGLGRTVPKVIGFGERLLGLGGVGHKVGGVIDKVRGGVDRGLDKVIGTTTGVVHDVADFVGGVGGNVVDRVGGVASGVGDFVGGAAGKVGGFVGGLADRAGGVAHDAAGSASSRAGEVVDFVGGLNPDDVIDGIIGAKDTTVGAIINMMTKSGDAKRKAAGGGDSGGDGGGNPIGDAVDAVGDAANDAANAAGDAANAAGNAAGDAADDAADAGGDVVDTVTNVVTGGGGSHWPW